MHIDLEQAEKAIAAARKKAIKIETQNVHRRGRFWRQPEGLPRMDDAWVGSIDIAIKKAKTACFFTMATARSASCRSRASRSMASSIPTRG